MADLELIQFRRGTPAKRSDYVLADGEPGWDGDALYIGDGVTKGGKPAGGSGGGLTQSVADARYVKQSDIGDLKGADGKDGQIRFTGHGAPGTIVGANPGDTYMNLDNGDIYKLS